MRLPAQLDYVSLWDGKKIMRSYKHQRMKWDLSFSVSERDGKESHVMERLGVDLPASREIEKRASNCV